MPSPIVEPIRAAVAAAHSQYVVGKAAGVDKGTLSRFVAGLITPRGDILDRLADHFGMEARQASPATKAGREPRRKPAGKTPRGVHRARPAKGATRTKKR